MRSAQAKAGLDVVGQFTGPGIANKITGAAMLGPVKVLLKMATTSPQARDFATFKLRQMLTKAATPRDARSIQAALLVLQAQAGQAAAQ